MQPPQQSGTHVAMQKKWFEVRLQIPAAAVDLVCNELAELGSDGVTVEERQLDTFIPPDPDANIPDLLQLKAYFPDAMEIVDLYAAVREQLSWIVDLYPKSGPWTLEIVPVRNEDWAEGWKQHFQATRIGQRLVIKPTWEEYAACRPHDAVIDIDPGMAFGTGTHGTTRLCLEALAELFEGDALPRRVLDVGTGSGILAIAAAALGGERILACDIDAEACRIARENIVLNGVEDRVEVSLQPVEELEGGFDIVLANILAEENARLADELVGRLAPHGSLILSGILQEKEELVIQAFARYPLQGPDIRHLEEWSCLVYRREE